MASDEFVGIRLKQNLRDDLLFEELATDETKKIYHEIKDEFIRREYKRCWRMELMSKMYCFDNSKDKNTLTNLALKSTMREATLCALIHEKENPAIASKLKEIILNDFGKVCITEGDLS